MSYTPGPWKSAVVYLDNEPNHYYVSAKGWGGRAIADCGLAEGDDAEWDTNQANARLIAAAPELLEALQLFADWNPTDSHIDEVVRRHDVARAAIARALG